MHKSQIPANFLSVVVLIAAFMIIVLAIFLIIFFVLSRKRQNRLVKEKMTLQARFKNELLQSQLETQEYAFNQISQELHDNIGQLLSSTKMLLNIGVMEMQTIPDSIKTAEQTVAKAIQDLRSLSKSLNNEWIHQFNLIENLEAEKNRINAARNIVVTFTSTCQQLPIEPEAQVMLFRVVQEALQNSIRHAAPQNIRIAITPANDHFQLSLEDDGQGFDAEAAKKESLGLRNMEHRVRLLGGSIAWQSAAGKGTLILIEIPVK